MKASSEHCAGVKSTTISHTLLLQCYILADGIGRFISSQFEDDS